GKGITQIAKDLTIGELIDSGMMELSGEESEYKYALIYCSNENNCGKCSLLGYFAYNVNGDKNVKDYWNNAHSNMNEDELVTHKNEWKDLTLTEFMNMLLGAI
ncbi:MAG: hypothetical protein K2M64_02740, partial [Clostridia bacterium]|nr:hypothetical protein [Clostridia bacterium]